MIPVVEPAAEFQSKSRNVYCEAITAREAITSTSATKLAHPLIQPTHGAERTRRPGIRPAVGIGAVHVLVGERDQEPSPLTMIGAS
jgi:hypothetical protein